MGWVHMDEILTTALAILSGVCLYAAVQHTWVGLRRPPQRAHLLFALLSLAVSLYVLAKLGAYRADSVQTLVDMRRAEFSFIVLIFSALSWFAAAYTGEWSRPWLTVLNTWVIVLFVANLVLPLGIFFVQEPEVQRLVLPWGERVTDLRVHQRGAWFYAALSGVLLSFVHAGQVCVRQYQRGERGRAKAFALALAVFVSLIMFNQAVNFGHIEFVHTAEFGFIALVLLMSRALGRELRQHADALKDSEARFRSLVEQSPFSIQMLTPDGRTTQVNRAWEAMWGVKQEAMANYNVLNDRQLVEKGVMPYLQRGFAGESVQIPPVVYNPQDTPEVAGAPFRDRWVRAYVYPIEDEARRVREVVLMHEDVTERKRTEAALQTSEERLRATLDNTPGVAVQWFDRAGRVLYWNTASEKLYGISAEQAVGKTMLELLHTPEQFREFLDLIATIERQGHACGPAEIDIRSISGAKVSVLYTMFAIPGAGTEPIFVCMDVNITERKRAEEAIKNIAAGVSAQTGENFFRDLVTHLAALFEAEYAFVGVFNETRADAMTTLAVCAHGAVAPNMTYVLANTPCANVVGQQTCAYPSGVQQLFPQDRLLVDMGAEGYIGTPLFDVQGAPIGIIAVLSQTPLKHVEQLHEMLEIFAARAAAEIQRLNAETRIRRMAYSDYLTGLANRAALHEHLAQVLRQALQLGQQGAMLLIDLDHFKTINDALSHEIGDLVLRDVARRLTETAANEAFVARLGGDEFVLVMPPVSDDAEITAARAHRLAESVANTLATPFIMGEQTLNVGASIGVVLFPQAGATELDILRHADIALYRAKSQGRSTVQFFLPSMQATVDERMQVERGLRQALGRGGLVLQFQPQLNRFEQVVGAEALLRWHRPGKGVVGPEGFITVAEETGLIHSIGQWVLAEACDRLRDWEGAALTEPLGLSVNVSSWQFVRDDFVRQVERQLSRSGASPARLTLEITESALFYDIEDAMEKMRALRALGLRLSMDDFGTGFSSLSYLKKLPLNELKIDRSFVQAIATETTDVFLRSIVAIGHALGMTVVGEGVETKVQRNALAAMGCDGFQGYLWSEPLSADALAEWAATQENIFTPAEKQSL
jgi:diguanylate cyclase (GGDEF)-like protein/PAS domain S-box-containing protein